MRERKIFRDRDKGLKVDETDERVIFVTFVMVSSLSSLTGAYVLRLEDREFQRQGAEMRKEWFENLRLDVSCRSERHRYSDELSFARWFDI